MSPAPPIPSASAFGHASCCFNCCSVVLQVALSVRFVGLIRCMCLGHSSLQEEALSKATSALEASQAKLEAEQQQLKAEREWLTEQQRTLTNDQSTLAAWRNDQVRTVTLACMALSALLTPGTPLTGCT